MKHFGFLKFQISCRLKVKTQKFRNEKVVKFPPWKKWTNFKSDFVKTFLFIHQNMYLEIDRKQTTYKLEYVLSFHTFDVSAKVINQKLANYVID